MAVGAAALWFFAADSAVAEPRFRADDGNTWHLADNPALPAATEGFTLGAALSPSEGQWRDSDAEVLFESPLLSLGYAENRLGGVFSWGTSLSFGDGFALGYRSDDGGGTTHNLGALWRPFDALSSALTVDDVSRGRVWGAGFAVRPLTLWRPGASWLSFTGDFAWGQRPEQRWGAKVSWNGSDLRAWYDVENRASGLEVTLVWGASETAAKINRLGQALRWSPSTPHVSPVVLRLRLPRLAASPLPQLPFVDPDFSLPALLNMLDRAAADPLVAAVVFEDPPPVGGLAEAQELGAAVQRLRASGKKVYVQADGIMDSLGYQGWLSAADRIALDPTGVLVLTAGSSQRLYLKDFFDKIGVRVVNLAPWDTKSANNPLSYSSMPEGERAMLKRFLTDRDALAAAALTHGRGAKLKRPAEQLVADGPYLAARDALDAGLVDVLENRNAFEEFVRKAHPGAFFVDRLPEAPPAWGPSITRAVAVVHLTGDILPGPGQAGLSIGRAAAETLAQLRQAPGVRAILLRVDSPGGAVQPSDALADEVRKTVAAGKLVVVSMGNVAASGGYYLSAPASRIFAEPGTLTGSIGVTAALFTAPKALEMLGIKSDGVELAPSAAFFDWTKAPTDATLQKWSSMIDATYQRFLDVVAEGRDIDKDTLEPLARGQIYTGREALQLGLVDELGGEYEARAWLEQQLGALEFVDIVPGESSVLGRLVAPLASAVVQASDSPTLKLARTLDQLSAPWAEAVAGLAARGGGPLVWVEIP